MKYQYIIASFIVASATTFDQGLAASCCDGILPGTDPGNSEMCDFNQGEFPTNEFLDSFCFCNAGPTAPSSSECHNCCVDTLRAEGWGNADLNDDPNTDPEADPPIEGLTQFFSCEDGCLEACRQTCNEERESCIEGICFNKDLTRDDNIPACRANCNASHSICNTACDDERAANLENLFA